MGTVFYTINRQSNIVNEYKLEMSKRSGQNQLKHYLIGNDINITSMANISQPPRRENVILPDSRK
jgi:hypothetical protein